MDVFEVSDRLAVIRIHAWPMGASDATFAISIVSVARMIEWQVIGNWSVFLDVQHAVRQERSNAVPVTREATHGVASIIEGALPDQAAALVGNPLGSALLPGCVASKVVQRLILDPSVSSGRSSGDLCFTAAAAAAQSECIHSMSLG